LVSSIISFLASALKYFLRKFYKTFFSLSQMLLIQARVFFYWQAFPAQSNVCG
jgi:hypothetical protein